MICNACGTSLSDASKFCNNCGAPVGSIEPKDEARLKAESSEEKAQAALSKEEAEKLVQKFAEAGVTIEIKYAEKQDELTVYTVFLHAVGRNKIEVLKIVREVTSLPLSNAKNLIEVAPIIVKEGLSKREAEKICQRLIEAGAIAEVEPSAPETGLPPILKSKRLPTASSSPPKPKDSATSGCLALLILFLIFICWATGQKPSRFGFRPMQRRYESG